MSLKIRLCNQIAVAGTEGFTASASRLKSLAVKSLVNDRASGSFHNAFSEAVRRQIRLLQRACMNSNTQGSVSFSGPDNPETILANIFSNIASSSAGPIDAGNACIMLEPEVCAGMKKRSDKDQAYSNEQEVPHLPG